MHTNLPLDATIPISFLVGSKSRVYSRYRGDGSRVTGLEGVFLLHGVSVRNYTPVLLVPRRIY